MTGHDVAVIGGGPAGATAAALLAKSGCNVVLAERARFPRFHIGESLLPCSMPVLREIGALPAIETIGVPKFGADFTDTDGRSQEILFERALNPSSSSAFQVKRAAFDQILLDTARDHGACVLQETTVRKVDLEADSGVRLEIEDPDGQRRRIEAKQVIDASGRDSLISRKLSMRTPNKRHQSAAVYGHYASVPRRDGDRAGHISIYWFDQGWIWFIPLPDGDMSVGAVCSTDYFRSRSVPLDRFLLDTLARAPEAARRMRSARQVEPVGAASNYSYSSARMCGSNYVLVGDAYAFVDPVFSSGVHLALHSATLAADLMITRLRSPDHARAKERRLERRIKRGLADISWLIYRVRTPAMRQLFLNPRNPLGVEQALISIMAGDLFGSPSVRWRFELFKMIYRLNHLRLAFTRRSHQGADIAEALQPMVGR